MTKVNLLKALAQAEQDSVPPFEVRCNRGKRFDRYKKHGIETPSDYWAYKYFQASGLVDACGVWGFAPQDLATAEKEEIDPEILGAIVKVRGRVDYEGEDIIKMAHLGLVPRTIQEFHRNIRGISRKMQLEKLEVPVARGVIALGFKLELILKDEIETPGRFDLVQDGPDCTLLDKQTGIRILFQAGDFNGSQRVMMPPDFAASVSELATIMRIAGEWLSENHGGVV